MASVRVCVFAHVDGRPCGAPPLRSGARCYWHASDTKEELAEAQRLGGLRRQKERALATVYHVGSVADLRTCSGCSTENTPARGRLLLGIAEAALKVQELARFEVEEPV